MAKIVSMSSGAIDPIAQSKRVFFRPAAADTVRVGDLVCYNWDIERDHKERASDPTHLGLRNDTYTEGAQDFTGRLFIVEKPTEENIQFFAGVVKALGPKAGADDDMIEIWVPNGAVLPVMSDQNCVNGQTIVCVRDAVYEGSFPSNDSRPIGVAMETKDRSSIDGLVWTKVDPGMFIWQASNADALLIDDETDAWTQVNKIQLEYAGAQWLEAFTVQLDFLAAMTGSGIAVNVDLNLYQTANAAGDNSKAIQGSVYLQSGFVATDGSIAALSGKIKDEATVDLTGLDICCLYLEHYIRAASTSTGNDSMIRCNATAGTNAPDYLFYGQNNESLGLTISVGTTGTKVGTIKCSSGGYGEFYIRVYDTAV